MSMISIPYTLVQNHCLCSLYSLLHTYVCTQPRNKIIHIAANQTKPTCHVIHLIPTPLFLPSLRAALALPQSNPFLTLPRGPLPPIPRLYI